MEQDQTVCPRCGEPAGGPGFCQACRSHIESLRAASSAGAHAADASYPATRALREVLRLEEALAAASKGISERIAAGSSVAAVQDEPAQGPTETASDDSGVVERANLLTSAGESSRTHGPREVARFEDLMTIDRRDRTEPTPAAPAPVTVNEPPADGREGASDPGEAAAEYSRQAFWFEYSPALKPEPADESVVEPEAELETPVSYVEPDPAESVAPPVAESIAPPVAEPISSPAPAPRNHWVTVLCLLALIGLVVALTGRNPRRVSGGQAS